MPTGSVGRRRVKTYGSVTQPGGGGGGATVVSAVVQRFDGGSSAAQPWGFLPFKESDNIQVSDLSKVRVWVGGVEQRIGVSYGRGRHNNGGLRACVFRLESRTVADASPVSAEVWYGGTTARQTSDITFTAPTSSEIITGAPAFIPTDAAYLCLTRFTMQPQIPASQYTTEETAKFVTWKASMDSLLDTAFTNPSSIGADVNNLGQGAFYPTCRGYLSSWVSTGNATDWWRGMRIGQHMYNLGSGLGETTGMIKQDFAMMHNATTQTGFWTEVKNVAVATNGVDGGGGLDQSTQAATMALFPSPTYGFRFSVRAIHAALGAIICDGKATGGPSFATRFPWIIDGLAAKVWAIGDCTDGITGCDPNATSEGRYAAPVFQVAVTNAVYMDYYNNVYADSRIPGLIKANCDAVINQYKALTGSNGAVDNYNAGSTHGMPYLFECPVTSTLETILAHMWASSFAFTYAYTGNSTYRTWYYRFIKASNVVTADMGTNRLKIWGEMGWAWSAPYYNAGNAPSGPSSIREPTSY